MEQPVAEPADDSYDPEIIHKYNYYIKDNYAYTSDHVLVYNLYICKIPRKTLTRDLYSHFSRYGRIKNVHMMQKYKRRGSKIRTIAFVCFKSAREAATALLAESHYILNRSIVVKAGESWRQPHFYEPADDSRVCLPDAEFPTDHAVDCVLRLNDDCLDHILQFLKLRDWVRFAQTCVRFRAVATRASIILHRHFELHKLHNMTPFEITNFFRIFGSNIKSITGIMPKRYTFRILVCISYNCKNLEHLSLEDSYLSNKSLYKISRKMKNIVDLRLEDCFLTDPNIIGISKLRKLKKLNLCHNDSLTGKHLKRLPPTLETLWISYTMVNENRLYGLSKVLPNLKDLNVLGHFSMTTSVYECMAANAKKLEILKIHVDWLNLDFFAVARIPSLKKLVVDNTSIENVSDRLLDQLVLHKASQLEYFHTTDHLNDSRLEKLSRLSELKYLVCPNNNDITALGVQHLCNLKKLEELVLNKCLQINNAAVLMLALYCPSLKRIHVESCIAINRRLIIDIIQNMRMQKRNKEFTRRKPLGLLVADTQITTEIEEDQEYIGAADLVRVYFLDRPVDMLDYDRLRH